MRRMGELLPEEKTLSVWLYGPPGVGKSKAAIQVAHLGRTLFIAVESGLMAHHLDGIPRENLVLVGPDTMGDFNVIYNKLKDYQSEYYKWFTTPNPQSVEKMRLLDEWFLQSTIAKENYVPKPFLFVIIDTLTDVQKDTIVHQLPRDAKDFTATKQMQIQQWGMSNAMLDAITDAYVSQEAPYAKLFVNTILISHEKTETDDEGAIARVCPALSGQNPKNIGAKVDVIGYVKLEPKANLMHQSVVVQKSARYRKYDVKDRTNKLGAEISDTTAGACDIMRRIMNNCGWLGKKRPELAAPVVKTVKEPQKTETKVVAKTTEVKK